MVLCAAGATSDFFDGYIARRTDSVASWASSCDPLADRIFIAALLIALVVRRTLPWWVAVFIVGRDLLVLSFFPYLERKKVERIAVNRVGKTATAALLMGLTLLAVSETDLAAAAAADAAGFLLTLVGGTLYWAAAYLYGREAIKKLQALGTPHDLFVYLYLYRLAQGEEGSCPEVLKRSPLHEGP